MKRDFELVRKIVADIADSPAGGPYFCLTYPGEYEDRVVFEHIELLIDAGLVEGKVQRVMSGIHSVMIRGLTWAGQDFYEAAAKDTLWNKAFSTVREKGGAMTFDVLVELLKSLAKSAAGLP
jgi:hypothetical protein